MFDLGLLPFLGRFGYVVPSDIKGLILTAIIKSISF
jgi:hypothetical protein